MKNLAHARSVALSSAISISGFATAWKFRISMRDEKPCACMFARESTERPTQRMFSTRSCTTMVSVNHKQRRGRLGFTLIELLASMTILIFIVMMMSRLFAETTQIWSAGTKRANTAGEARVIMDYIVKEMSQAIADDVVSFKLNSG